MSFHNLIINLCNECQACFFLNESYVLLIYITFSYKKKPFYYYELVSCLLMNFNT